MDESEPLNSEAARQYELHSQQPRGHLLDSTVGDASSRPGLTEDDLGDPPRKVRTPLLLFVLTVASTFLVGATGFHGYEWLHTKVFVPVWCLLTHQRVPNLPAPDWSWKSGLVYMSAVMGILIAHEMGHFLQTVRYRIHSSWPLFIPMPVSHQGTMGAVIAMDGSRADRKQLFDIGISGPIAGLVIALPVTWFGLKYAEFVPAMPVASGMIIGDPWIFDILRRWVRPDVAPNADLLMQTSPLAMAGWLGMMVTGLNMLPISQLDGGHVVHALFGRFSFLLARLFALVAIAFISITRQYEWVVMLLLIYMIGVDHPPTRDDTVELGWPRKLLGFASLAIPIFCFIPWLIPEAAR
jgi:Zn-dependent protease